MSMEFSEKIKRFMILKLTKNYGFTLSLENIFFWNQEGVTHVFYKIIQKTFFAKHFRGTTFAFHKTILAEFAQKG